MTHDVATGVTITTTAKTPRSLRTPLENFGIPLLLAHPDMKELRLTAMYLDPSVCQGSFGGSPAEGAFRFPPPELYRAIRCSVHTGENMNKYAHFLFVSRDAISLTAGEISV